jgi:cytochrome c oxidase cbb3-type subunit 3
MSNRPLLILICAVLIGCKREHRELRTVPPLASPVATVQVTDLQPGISAAELTSNAYEKNSYHLSEGQRLYENFNCVGCHAHGGGDIGPPLSDDKWIYGFQPQQVFASIVQGRPKGMPAFGSRLNENQVWEIVAYVRSLGGQAPKTAASGRSDHMQIAPPPNSVKRTQPKNVSSPD